MIKDIKKKQIDVIINEKEHEEYKVGVEQLHQLSKANGQTDKEHNTDHQHATIFESPKPWKLLSIHI